VPDYGRGGVQQQDAAIGRKVVRLRPALAIDLGNFGALLVLLGLLIAAKKGVRIPHFFSPPYALIFAKIKPRALCARREFCGHLAGEKYFLILSGKMLDKNGIACYNKAIR
jgi:hypothetical protein